MSNPLTLVSAAFASDDTGFGQALSGGYGYLPSTGTPYPAALPYTLRGRLKTSATSAAVQVAFGAPRWGWIGKDASNRLVAHCGGGGGVADNTLTTSVTITDGVWHDVELVATSSGSKLYLDGVQVATNAGVQAVGDAGYYFGVGAFFTSANSASASFNWGGEVNEVAVFNTALHATAFTPPTSPFTGSESGLQFLYHLDGNGNDSTAAASPATALTLSAATTGTVGTANTVTVGANGSLSASVTVNLTATDGAYSPSSVTLTTGTPSATSSYTPASTGAKTLTATDAAAALTAATATQTESATVTPTFDQTAILFSPGNWSVGTSTAKTINDGAYFKTIFAGTSMALSFDVSATSTPMPKLVYRVDGIGAWVTVDLAATVNVTMPTETAALTTHFIEVYVAQTSEANSRWSPQNTAVILTGITLSAGGLTLPAARPLSGLWFGDSIMCGINVIGSSGDSTVRGRQQMAYPYLVSELLGVEFGVVAFGGQGWQKTGGGSVPVFPTTYNLLWGSGPARSFAGLDFIVINQGQNDGANATTSQVTTVLNALIAATDRRTKIIVLEPLSGLQNANLIAGIAATTAPGRITYINTFTGVNPVWFNNANSADAVHPFGFEHRNSITPKAVVALRPYLQPIKGAVTAQAARTVTLTLVDSNGAPRANLTGIKWSIFDQVTPDAQAVAVDQGVGATTNGSGVITLSVFSTKAAGANVWLTLSNSDGTVGQSGMLAFAGPAVLS
jgi:hypothetical protein